MCEDRPGYRGSVNRLSRLAVYYHPTQGSAQLSGYCAVETHEHIWQLQEQKRAQRWSTRETVIDRTHVMFPED